jgi:hypothetical protein
MEASAGDATAGPLLVGVDVVVAEARRVVGITDILVVGNDEITTDVFIARETPRSLHTRFGKKMVFLRHHNLNRFPKCLQGAIAWLPKEDAIVMIVKASWCTAVVRQLYPEYRKTSRGGIYVTNLVQNGWFLQQVAGKVLVEFDSKIRVRKVNSETSMIVPLLDDEGNIKCDWKGPDIGTVAETDLKIPVNFQALLSKREWVKDNGVAVIASMRKTAGTVYVYAKRRSDMKSVLVDPGSGRALVSVPLQKIRVQR